MQPFAMAFLTAFAPQLALAGNDHCDVRISQPARNSNGWIYQLDVKSKGWMLAGVAIREQGQDLVVEIQSASQSRYADVAPSRYAVERATILLSAPARVIVNVRAFDGELKVAPTVSSLCSLPGDSNFAPWLLWQGLIDLVHLSDTPSSEQQAARLRAIEFAENLRELGAASGFDFELLAGATHVQGYLASRIGKRDDARELFTRASVLWERAGSTASAAVARFNVAQENLALGRAAEALRTLQPLLVKTVRLTFPPIWVWASNDRCVALRNLDRRNEAEQCLARLIPLFDALGEPKEAANALCNLGAALGAEGRWPRAGPTLQRCRARRERLGAPSGVAHSELLLGWYALEADSVDEAIRHFERSIAQASKAGDVSKVWDARRWLAQAWLDGDEVARARAALTALSVDEVQEASRNAQWHMAMAQIELYGDNPIAAREHLATAANRFQAIGQTASLVDAQCLWALVDTKAPIDANCDRLTAAQAYLLRGEPLLAGRRLQAHVIGSDRELLRKFLLCISQSFLDREMLSRLATRAEKLSSSGPRERSQRGQLLARIGYELARLAYSNSNGHIAKLAFDTLWIGGAGASGLGRRLIDGPAPTRSAIPTVPRARAFPIARGTVAVTSTSFLGVGYLLIARGNEVTVRKIDMPHINEGVERWRKHLLSREETSTEARSMADALSLASWWSAEDRHLVLSIHGKLTTMPWSALWIPGTPQRGLGYRPLVSQATTVYVTSSTRAAPFPRIEPSVGFYPLTVDASLPGAHAERLAIELQARKAGWGISEGTVRYGGILHIAGHAVADTELAGGSGLLHEDQQQLNPLAFPSALVRESALVVLAGCETAYGATSRWTQSSSLASRAVAEGARAALGHLWPISDVGSMRFHIAFYGNVFSGLSTEDALREAQLEQINSPESRMPMLWASPVLLVRPEVLLHR